jgi:SulP family sulfate permease
MTVTGSEPMARKGLWRNMGSSAMIGAIAGMDNLTAALAMGALMFSGPISEGMGLGVGVVLLGGALLALAIALRSLLPNSIALVQETTVAILAAAIVTMTVQTAGDTEVKIATAIGLIGVSSIITGLLFWLVGRLKLGGMVRFLPYPVIAGFLAGSGWLLVDGAASMLTDHGIGIGFLQALGQTEILWRILPAVALACAMFLLLGRFSHPATMPLIMIGAVAVFYIVLQVSGMSVETARALGYLPPVNSSGGIELPTPALLGKIDWWAVAMAWPSLLVVAGLSIIGLMLNITGLELALGRDLDVNAELRSSGIANMLSGGVGGPSGYVGLSMTALAQKTGATGRSAGIATAVFMLVGLFAAGSLIFQVPVFLTGGFVLFLGVELLKEWLIDTRSKMPSSEWLVIAVIVATVASVGFMEGLAVGLLVSSAVFVVRYSRLPVVRLQATGVEQRSTVDRSPAAVKFLSNHGDTIEIVQLQGYLFFGTADRVVDLVRLRLAAPDKVPLRFIVLDFRDVSGADSAAISCFAKIRRLVEAEDVKVCLTSVPADLLDNLAMAGIEFGADQPMQIDTDLDHALERVEEAILFGQGEGDVDTSLLKHFAATIGQHPRLSSLIDNMTKLEMKPDDVLIRQGDDANDVFFVATGRVRVQITLPGGNVLRVRTMLAGAIVGEIALYLHQPRTADVIVDAPSDIYRLSAADLARLEQDDPELAALAHRLLACNLSEKLSVANKMIQVTRR